MGKGDKRAGVFSSAKAAEALAASGRGAGGFGGFAGSASTAAGSGGFAFGAKYVGAVAAAVPGGGGGGGGGEAAGPSIVRAAAIIPSDLDGELAQQLQKLGKRDATTKLKALQALRALAQDKPAEDLQTALPSWAYAYGRLIMDNNRAVRAEASHACAALAAAVGRGVAPLLKSLLPAWWLAGCDAHAEAAAAARGAFAAAFPAAAKRRDALLFCRAEVVQLLSDNLASTPQALGDPKKESPEELQDRHERVLASSCAALAALLDVALGGGEAVPAGPAGGPAQQQHQQLPVAERELLDGVGAQLQLLAFYKAVLQSKAAAVRRQAYLLVADAAARAPALLAPAVATAAPAVLGALADKEPSAHEALWGMLLAFARAFPDGWTHINMQKAFLLRLWSSLRHGCYGSAASSLPALLPLVSHLPEATLGPRPATFSSLLSSIWQGLATLNGRQARQAAAAAYLECLLYALLRADHLAAVGGEAAAAGGAAAAASGQQYCSELLQEVLQEALLPAVLSGGAEAAEAEAVLTGVTAKLGQPTASSSTRQRLAQLLQLAGSALASSLREALSVGGGSPDAAAVFDRTAVLVAALDQAAGPGAGAALGTSVAQPLVALLLPEVRTGMAPPAASSLLAGLLKAFPQHAAVDAPEAGAPAPAAEQQQGSGPAAATAAGTAVELAALRLHQSASFTIESILRRLTEGLSEEQQPEAATASCDLLLSCLPQVHHPARKLGDVVTQLTVQQRHGTSLLLLQHLVSGQHAALAAAAAASGELDKAAAASFGSNGGWLQLGDVHMPALLALLLAGSGSISLLSPAGQAAVLAQLLEQLQAAVAAERGTAHDAPAAAPVLHVLQRALLSPALDASSILEVQALRVHLLAAALALLLHQTAAEAAEAEAALAAGSDSDHEASAFVDDSDAESEEVPRQLGADLAAARQLWQKQAAIGALLSAAPAEQQAAFLEAAQQAAEAALQAQPSPSAALAAADAMDLLLAAVGSGSLHQQLLQRLLLAHQQADEAAAAGSSSSSGSGSSGAWALFLASLGAAAGFDALLPPSGSESPSAAVRLLAALTVSPAADAAERQLQVLQHVAGAAAEPLLQPALAAAAAAAGASPSHADVLCALLQAAVSGGGASSHAAAAFFAEATAEGSAALPQGLLLRVLPIAAPAFRGGSALLEQSGLPQLSQRLCQQCTSSEPAAVAAAGGQQGATQLLRAAVACFPCATGAEAAAQLPSPAAAFAGRQQQPDSAAGPASFAKGDAVWYCQAGGSWAEAEVAAVDTSVHPPSYAVKLGTAGSSLRETEASRLRTRAPGSAPPASAQQAAASAAAAAAAAAQQRAAAGAALEPVGCCTQEEQAALLALLQYQVRGVRAAAAAARAAGSPADPSPAVSAAVASLLHSAVAYCGAQLTQQQWSLLLEQLRGAFTQCAAALVPAAGRVARAVCAAAGEIAVGADMSSPTVALQFFRRLSLKGVLERSEKARGEAAKVAAALSAELAALDAALLPLLLPALQAYTRVSAAAGTCRALPQSEWQAAEAAACGDMLQLFVTAGSVAAAASVSGRRASGALARWMGGGQEGGPAAEAWQLLSQHAAVTLRGADRPFLLAAVDRANAGMDATGVDALGALLALSLSGLPPPSMAAAAFAAILQHPELTSALTAAEGVDEESLEEQEQQQQQQQQQQRGSDGGDAAAALEQVGVRPELAAAVAASGGAGFFTAWALLLAHMLAAPADSHGRRLLAQALKDAHTLVPSLLDSLVPLLPLDGAGGSRRDSTGSAAAGSSSSTAGGSAAAASGGGGGPGGSGFASQVAAVGPFPSSSSSSSSTAATEVPPAAAHQQQRFAVLLYAAALQALPASARLWFADLRDRGTAAAAERYTAAAVSGQLLATEFAEVTEAASKFGKFDKFSARANPNSREVIAVMEVEDGHLLELAVRLPASMPLRPPELECRRKVGVSEGRLRKWLLSISAFLRMQNGSVAEAIILWKRNVEKEFEGQEECLICYSIIQPTSGQLPRLSCRTCRKRFHGGCLYKWFRSSQKSTCPHCQSPWQLARAQAAPTPPVFAGGVSAAPVAPAAPVGRSAAATAAAMSTAATEPEVLARVERHAEVATLNRPRALNALNTTMVERMYEVYSKWEADPAVACIVLKGAGEKAFCAGGDVKTVVQQGLAGRFDDALRFFRSEYKLNHLISRLRKPHVALIDGITMGGGVGVSVHGTFRVATERTVFSMPECAIGLYPDVGGSYFLPRLRGGLGLYLALTGARLTGVDVRHAGLATHYIPSRMLPEVHQAIVRMGYEASDASALNRVLTAFETREELLQGQLAAVRADIDFCFGGRQSVEDVYAACERAGQWGREVVALMLKGSPTSQKVSFEQLRRGASMDLAACLQMENRMVHRCVEDVTSDFYTGVQAALIHRTGSPAWQPATLKEVSDDRVQAFFDQLPPEQELQLPAEHEAPRSRL